MSALETFAGKTLDGKMPAGTKTPPPEALGLLRLAAAVLDEAHARGEVHGNLHPGRIAVTETGEVKIEKPPSSGPEPPELLKAVPYLAPERIRDASIDARSDQFSLAVLAHRLLTGSLPFTGTPVGAMFRIAFTGVERAGMRDLPEPAQSVLMRALARVPAERYSTCGEMVKALEGALNPRPAAAATRIAAAPLPPPKRVSAGTIEEMAAPLMQKARLQGWKYFAATFVVCVIVLGGIFYLLAPKSAPPPKTAPVVQASPPPAEIPQPPAPVQATPPATPRPKAKPAAKKEPEVELKPVEPKTIRH